MCGLLGKLGFQLLETIVGSRQVVVDKILTAHRLNWVIVQRDYELVRGVAVLTGSENEGVIVTLCEKIIHQGRILSGKDFGQAEQGKSVVPYTEGIQGDFIVVEYCNALTGFDQRGAVGVKLAGNFVRQLLHRQPIVFIGIIGGGIGKAVDTGTDKFLRGKRGRSFKMANDVDGVFAAVYDSVNAAAVVFPEFGFKHSFHFPFRLDIEFGYVIHFTPKDEVIAGKTAAAHYTETVIYKVTIAPAGYEDFVFVAVISEFHFWCCRVSA